MTSSDNGREEQWTKGGKVYGSTLAGEVVSIWVKGKLKAVGDVKAEYADAIIDQHNNGLAARAQAGLAQRYREALEGCWGQQEDGDLRFVVRVSGIGASPKSPVEIARELTQTWTAAMQGRGVVVDESSREALTAGPTAAAE